MIYSSRHARRLAPLAIVLLTLWLAACGAQAAPDKTYTIAAYFPVTGADAAIGQAMQRAVDLAVQQNAALGHGYTLTVAHFDETDGDPADVVMTLAADRRVMGIVGPSDSQTALGMLPGVAQTGLTTISPSALLAGLTQADAAAAQGIAFTQLHPKGAGGAFFRLPATDRTVGKAAADLAVAPTASSGLAARAVFVVDDGTLSGKALAAAFSQELKARQGTVAGQRSILLGAPNSAQSAVTAIIEANPDIVFYAGGIASGAALRSTLSLTGAPQLSILSVGPIANDPAWSTAVGVVPASAYTTAMLPARDLSTLKGASSFITAYQSAYPKQALLPQSALAYDAAMDEITAIRSLIAASKPVTRAAVLAIVTSAKYVGVTGTLAFDKNGDSLSPPAFSVYTCDTKGTWSYQTSIGG
ncbi:MAG: branched-chain amino acid ABC transporter substrate-binding protein [Ktedonobacterales bacterium]|nr:branched-chain amino acid ABC transporter substrate-binding protein [Ktedonobacterales bacterium]